MKSSTEIVRFTPAVLRAVCKKQRVSKRKYRLNTLKSVRDELGAILESTPMDDTNKVIMKDLHEAVRLAIGEE